MMRGDERGGFGGEVGEMANGRRRGGGHIILHGRVEVELSGAGICD